MNIGMQELLVIAVLGLVVLGPERLPTAIRSIALWSSRMRRSFNDLKAAVEREIDADGIREQIHNEQVLHELGETRDALEAFGRQASIAPAGTNEHNSGGSSEGDTASGKPFNPPE